MPIIFDEVEGSVEPNPQTESTRTPEAPCEPSQEQKLDTLRAHLERLAVLEARLAAH
ncbi:MAG TPA: hypothetical protein VFZ34_03065 [Blastocatellia bacterium]|nr:hypothetical protein [Blastocatellia bacterium]